MNLDLMSSCPPLKGFELILVNHVLDSQSFLWQGLGTYRLGRSGKVMIL